MRRGIATSAASSRQTPADGSGVVLATALRLDVPAHRRDAYLGRQSRQPRPRPMTAAATGTPRPTRTGPTASPTPRGSTARRRPSATAARRARSRSTTARAPSPPPGSTSTPSERELHDRRQRREHAHPHRQRQRQPRRRRQPDDRRTDRRQRGPDHRRRRRHAQSGRQQHVHRPGRDQQRQRRRRRRRQPRRERRTPSRSARPTSRRPPAIPSALAIRSGRNITIGSFTSATNNSAAANTLTIDSGATLNVNSSLRRPPAGINSVFVVGSPNAFTTAPVITNLIVGGAGTLNVSRRRGQLQLPRRHRQRPLQHCDAHRHAQHERPGELQLHHRHRPDAPARGTGRE